MLLRIFPILLFLAAQASAPPVIAQEVEGMVHLTSRHSVQTTVDRLDSLLRTKGLTLFSRIDFAADARRAGLSLHESVLLIFGNPAAGTPLMAERPTTALDLPLKALVWEDDEGTVRLSYNDPDYIGKRHHVDPVLIDRIRGVDRLFRIATE